MILMDTSAAFANEEKQIKQSQRAKRGFWKGWIDPISIQFLRKNRIEERRQLLVQTTTSRETHGRGNKCGQNSLTVADSNENYVSARQFDCRVYDGAIGLIYGSLPEGKICHCRRN